MEYCNGSAWTSIGGGSITLGASASATNPQVSGDATTGFFSPAASTVAVSTGGTERFRVNASGNVGIGTTSPATTLHVYQSTGVTRVAAQNNSALVELAADPANGYVSTEGTGPLQLRASSATDQMTITTGGFVGIGTTSPANGLTLYNQVLQVDAPGGNAQMRVDSNPTGRAEILFGDNDGTSTFFALGKDSTNSNFVIAYGSSINGGSNIVLNSSGNVGIRTTAPATSLDVAGTVRSTAQVVPSSGAGVELLYSGGQGYVTAFDRTGSAYLPLNVTGLPLALNATGGGYVGIGTTSPTFPFTVQNNLGVSSGGHILTWAGQSNSGTSAGIYTGYVADGSAITGSLVGSGGNATGGNVLFLGNNINSQLLTLSSGNVGIGTTAPGQVLQVAGTVAATGALGGTVNANGVYQYDNGTNGFVAAYGSGGVARDLDIDGQNLHLFTGSTYTEKLTILSGGNVGIGTTSPQTTLQVNGGVSVGVVTLTSNYTATSSNYLILCNPNSGGFTITLPPAQNKGQIIIIKDIGTSNNCSFQTQGSDTFGDTGGTSNAIGPYSNPQVSLVADGISSWWYLVLPGPTH